MTKDMNTLPEHVKSFNNELAEMLTQKPPVSSSKMKDITRCAMKAQKYYKHIVMSVEKLIQKCKPEYKLSGVYVIDGIVRQSRHQNKDRDVYAGRFEVNIHVTAQHLFKCSRTDQVKICRTFKLWELNGVFSYHSMQKCLNNSAPDIRKEGIQLAEKSKMAVKPVTVTSDLAKQQKELEEQRRKIKQQEEELQRKKEALLQNQNLSASSIPPILNSLLHFGASSQSNENAPPPEKDTATKVKSLLDDFDYSDEDEIRQPTGGKKGTPKSKTATPPGSTATPKKVENVSTPSPITTTHDTSIYEPDPVPVPTEKTYDTKDLEKLYTPSPIEKTSKRTKTKSPEKVKEKKSHKRDKSSERSSRRESEKSRDRDRSRSEHDSSRDTSRDHKSRDDSSRRRSSPDRSKKSSKSSNRGKRSRSTSPDHYSRKRDRISKPDCVSVLSTTIWIGNLRKTVTKEDIASLMKKYTNKCTIDMVSARGCSYINLNEREIAETVLKELKDLKLHGAPCKVAWAPGKGCKEHREHWNMDKGITFIPHKTFEKLKITLLEEGGFIAQSTLPQGFKIAETEGAGSILEKLLVSMKGTSHEDPTADETPLGQFLSNGAATIARQEERVNAKLDKLNDIALPSSRVAGANTRPRDEDSIVHLLNSKEYDLPMPDPDAEEEEFNYYPGMSPPVTLPIPKEEEEAEKEVEEPTPVEKTTPVVEEPLPYSRPAPDTTQPSETAETPSPSKAEKKTINLQTYLKRKKEDDHIAPTAASPEQDVQETLPPTPVKTPRETDVDDLLEWASQDTEVMEDEEEEVEEEKKKEEVEEEEKQEPEEEEKIEETLNSIRSPSTSPVDSLLEEKLASPSADQPSSTLAPSSPAPSSPAPSSQPAPSSPPPAPSSPSRPMEEGEISEDAAGDKAKQSRSRSASTTKKIKKAKKKKNKKKKKREVDSDLEEDIRKLEFLKAELEREERREKREKERKREGKERKRSLSPRTAGKDKRKKEKRLKR